eukprot:gene25295-33824_t
MSNETTIRDSRASTTDYQSITNSLSHPLTSNESSASQENNDAFVCTICFEPVKDRDPVVTQCGHLYCWPCLFRWLNSNHTACPVCKAGVTQENVIPIFLSSSGSESDRAANTKNVKLSAASDSAAESSNSQDSTANVIPNRPAAHRPEPLPAMLTAGGGPNQPHALGGVSFSAGFGFFPSLFGLQFQSFVPPPGNANNNAAAAEEIREKVYLTRILYALGFSVLFCLLLF